VAGRNAGAVAETLAVRRFKSRYFLAAVTANPVIRVLLADDQPDVMDMLTYAFSVYGSFEVVARASDGATAVAQARELHPDVAVIDLMMPRMNGFEAIAQIRLDAPEVRIAVLSAVDDPTSRRLAGEAGADLYLVKGVFPRKIAQQLVDLMASTHQKVL
jgi:DNA-binding NarL/FixJ family response regulator